MAEAWLSPQDYDDLSEAFAGSRTSRCRLKRPATTFSSGGAPEYGWEDAGELSCRVEAANRAASEGLVARRLVSEVDYTAAFGRRATVSPEWRIEVDGLRLEVIAAPMAGAELVVACRSVG